MDKKTSVSTVILVLLIILTLVSLSASAYLYFTFNPIKRNNQEEVNEYEGWHKYVSPDLRLSFYYPDDLNVKETEEKIQYGDNEYTKTEISIRGMADEMGLSWPTIYITADDLSIIPGYYDAYYSNTETGGKIDIVKYLEDKKQALEKAHQIEAEVGTDIFSYEKSSKWGLDVYKYSEFSGGGDAPGISGYYIAIDRLYEPLIYKITYYDTDIVENLNEKVLNSIEFK